MEFDDTINLIGQFGPYQKRIVILLFIASTFLSLQILGVVFTLAIPEHRCAVPDVPNETFAQDDNTQVNTFNITIPVTDSYKVSQCQIFRLLNSSKADETYSLNSMSHIVSNHTFPCKKRVYDTFVFERTLISELDLVCEQKMGKTHVQMFAMLGALVGCLLIGPPGDLFGRKKVFMACLVVQVCSGIALAFTWSFVYLCVVTFFLGGASHSLYCACFVLAMEFVGVKKRQLCGYLNAGAFGVGVVILSGLAYFIRDWQHLQLAMTSFTFLLIGHYWLIPESPRWLVSRNRYSEAESIIRRAARVNKREVPPGVLKWDSLVTGEVQEPLWRIITYPRLVIRSLIIFFNWMACCIVYYGLTLNIEDLGGSIFLTTFLFGVVEALSCLVCLLLSNRIGRKKLYLSSLFLAGLSCAASPFPKVYGGPDYRWLTVTFAIIGKFGASAAFGTIWIYSSELFPTVIRSSGMASSSVMARIGGIISPYIANMSIVIEGRAGQILPLEVFGGLSLIAGFISLFLPETKNAKLPETLKDANDFGRNVSRELNGKRELDSSPFSIKDGPITTSG